MSSTAEITAAKILNRQIDLSALTLQKLSDLLVQLGSRPVSHNHLRSTIQTFVLQCAFNLAQPGVKYELEIPNNIALANLFAASLHSDRGLTPLELLHFYEALLQGEMEPLEELSLVRLKELAKFLGITVSGSQNSGAREMSLIMKYAEEVRKQAQLLASEAACEPEKVTATSPQLAISEHPFTVTDEQLGLSEEAMQEGGEEEPSEEEFANQGEDASADFE